MSLTKGSGPFGEHPAGSRNVEPPPPEHVLYVERSSRRVRVSLAGRPVADSAEPALIVVIALGAPVGGF